MTGKLEKRRTWLYWLVGAAMATALMAAVWLFGDMRYAGNDDAAILRPFMGFGCTEIPNFHLYLHPILLYPLCWLSLGFPEQAWFSWMQLAFLWLSATVSVKCLMQGFVKNGRSPLWGALCGMLYLAVFAMLYCCRVTYTVTAAMLGAAAVLQVLSIDGKTYTGGQVLRSLLLALVLVVLAYGLRQLAALPILAFCALAFVYLAMRDFGLGKHAKRALKPLVCFLIVAAVLFGGLVVGREMEIKAKGMEDYLRWQRARISVMDYYDFRGIPAKLKEEIGWTDAELQMIFDWYFIDGNITSEAFEKVERYMSAQDARGFGERLQAAAALASGLREREPIAWRSVRVLMGLLALCAVALLMRGRKGVLWQWLCLGAGIALAMLLLMYLGLEGRLPLRAALLPLLPLAALVTGLLPDCLPEPKKDKSPAHIVRVSALVLLSFCVLVLCAGYVVPAAREIAKPAVNEQVEEDLNPFADLDELAAMNPDFLYIYDSTFSSDARMFPSTENGVPDNVMFWGGWTSRSPEYMQQLASFDIDPANIDATIFLRDDVYLARGYIGNEPDALTAYIAESCGHEVYYQSVEEWGGVHIGQFYAE